MKPLPRRRMPGKPNLAALGCLATLLTMWGVVILVLWKLFL